MKQTIPAGVSEAEVRINEAMRNGDNHLSLQNLDLNEIPQSLLSLKQLELLDLSQNQLTMLPESFSELINLRNLDLSQNQIVEFPETICKLKNLQTLNISNNQISTIPESFGNLINLEYLFVSENQIGSFPESFMCLTRLRSLFSMQNRLTELPESFGNLSNLRDLYLSRNQISTLPESLGNLTNLQTLSLWNNQLISISNSIVKLTALEHLDLWLNNITFVPEGIENLTKLQFLDLSNNKITSFPESLGNLINLQELALSKTNLEVIPRWVGNLTNLKELHLWGNNLTIIPEWLGNLTELRILDLSSNIITSFPESLSNLTNLQELRIADNELTTVPDWLSELINLKSLTLSRNKIHELPEWMGQLENLEVLILDKNKLADVPSSLARLTRLKKIDLLGNPLYPDLEAAQSQGTETLLQFIRECALEEVVLNEAKLVLVGEGAVGKSSLLGALRGELWIHDRKTTHGVEIRSLSLDSSDEDKGPLLNCWDFGGQPVYRPTHQLFFSTPAVYLVVWKPREGPEQGFVEYWIKLIKHRTFRDQSDNYPRILIVATHGGPKERQAHIDEQGLRNQFGKLIVGFYHVDSFTKEGIEELKKAITDAVISIPQVGRKIPASWKKTIDIIKRQSGRYSYIKYNKFVRLCTKARIRNDLISTYARILHELGYVIYYADDEGLKDIIILKPDWLSRAISYVLEDRQVKEGHGLVEHKHLLKLWNDPEKPAKYRYPKNLHPIFLQLMERCDLSYRIVREGNGLLKSPETSLIAQLVPGDRPENISSAWNDSHAIDERELTQVCVIVDAESKKPARAEGIMFLLIVRLHRYSLGRENYNNSCHWQTGIILDDNYNGRAFLEQIGTDIKVIVRAAYPERFLHMLCEEIKWLVEHFWRGLKCQISIPCPNRGPLPCKGLFDIEELINSQKNNRPEYPCRVCYQWANVDALLTKPVSMPNPNTIQSELKEIKKAITTGFSITNANLRMLISQGDEQFAALMTTLTDEARDGPRLFSITPIDPGFWDKPEWISQKFRLTLWCEHSRLPVSVLWNDPKRGVYEFEKPREWLIKIAPYARKVSAVLSIVLPVAGSIAKFTLDDESYGRIEKDLELSQKSMEAIISVSDIGDKWLTEEEAAKTSVEIVKTQKDAPQIDSHSPFGKPIKAQGAQLRELQALLKDRDPGFGGLKRVKNRRNEFLWIHPKFEKEYYPDPPIIPSN